MTLQWLDVGLAGFMQRAELAVTLAEVNRRAGQKGWTGWIFSWAVRRDRIRSHKNCLRLR